MNINNNSDFATAINIKNVMFTIGCVTLGVCLSTSEYASAGYPNTPDPNSIYDPNSITDPNTIAEPNSISSVSDWVSLTNNSSVWDRNYILTCNIDLSGIAITPVGTSSVPFTGTIDGNSFVISNAVLNCSDENYVGLIGYLGDGGEVLRLGVESVTTTGNKFVGGLVGYTYFGLIEDCYCTGIVNGTSEVGGLIGRNNGQITGCYSTCSVTGQTSVGGLAGTNYGLAAFVKMCYATGTVTYTGSGSLAGGVVGDNSGFVYSCFWDTETSGLNGSSGGKGLPTDRMKDITIYQNAGWFDSGWTINDGQAYPKLVWENADGVSIPEAELVPLNGIGTKADPYQVSTADELALLSRYVSILDKYIVVTSDIEASSTEVSPIGSLGPFTGVFDGAGHIIENLTIAGESNDYAGLFGIVHNAAISNLGVHDVNVAGKNYVGGLIGCNLGGQVYSCYVTGEVRGESNVGGLIGYSSVNLSQN